MLMYRNLARYNSLCCSRPWLVKTRKTMNAMHACVHALQLSPADNSQATAIFSLSSVIVGATALLIESSIVWQTHTCRQQRVCWL